jgi:hypothetical protein
MRHASAMARRLARLETAAATRYKAWLETLTDDELDALCKDMPPDVQAAFDAMTDDELERLAAGRMSRGEWHQRVERARQQVR